MLAAGGTSTSGSIATRMGKHAGTVYQSLKRLSDANLVRKIRPEVFSLTELGEKEAKDRESSVELDNAKLTDSLIREPHERKEVEEALEADIQRWKDEALYWRDKFAQVCLELAKGKGA